MADESKQQQTSKGPGLEPRKNRAPFYGDEPKRAETTKKERGAEDSRAIYLIEREAIWLRRFRWEQKSKAVDAAATDAAQPQTAGGTAETRVGPQDDTLHELLTVYARPPSPQQTEARETLLTRTRQWVKSLIGKRKSSR